MAGSSPEIRVVAAALMRDGRVLAARRGPGQRQAGLWELPGGKVEAGESDAEALQRELAEELDLRIQVGEVLAENIHQYPDLTIRLVALKATLGGDQQPCATEHDALCWLGPDALHTVDWAPADIPLLDAVQAALRAGGLG